VTRLVVHVARAEGENVERCERCRDDSGELAGPFGGRVDMALWRGEVDPAVAWQHQFAVKAQPAG
jgi:hypothetical protein